ncbi:FCS-Like Zinc finger 2-like [Helianthus annuus]|uniref:FCS-Like Zinc finger 2-like n=1 Tax=Helianthus annuus TaxID=4232 RepID=UPI000B905789|nr:FCS-Like Zinc finger 2-like [Helianthus annuus]
MSVVHSTNKKNVTKIQPVSPVNTCDRPSTQHVNTMNHKTSASSVPIVVIESFKHCFACKKFIGNMVDIYIYMDMAFCSNECRSKEMDKVPEKMPKKHVTVNMRKRSRKDKAPKRAAIA